MKTLHLVAIANFLLLLVCSCATVQHSDRYAINEISFYSTPGKLVHLCIDWKPARQITVMSYYNQHYLIVSRNLFLDTSQCYREAREVLRQAEWDSTISIARQQQLIDFVPARREGMVLDYSSQGLSIIGTRCNQQHWDAPLVNESVLTPLLEYLDKLVKSKLPFWAD